MVNQADGGGTIDARSTSWGTKGIDEMWYMVDSADYAAYGQLITGWKRASELAYLHKSRLESYKRHLSSIWSVEESDAAKVYIAEIDRLIVSVQDTADVAADNQTVSTGILSALYEARNKLKPIYDEYRALNGTGTNGEQVPTDAPSGESPGAVDPKLALQSRAQSVMYGLSTDLSQSQRQFVQPKPYIPPSRGIGEERTQYGGSNENFITPLIPIPQTTPTPPQFLSTPTSVTPVPHPIGPDLTSLTPTQTTTPPSTTVPTSTIGTPTVTPTGLPPTGLIGNPTTTPGTSKTIGPTGRGLAPQGIIGGGPPSAARPVNTTASLRANPPGGLIGGGVPPRGGPGAAAIGGRPVIGGTGRSGLTPQGTIGGPMGASGLGRQGLAGGPGGPGGRNASMLPGMGGRPGQCGDNEDGPDFDPDTEWSVAQGVSPVVHAPAADGPVNPGPAIGL